MVERTVADREDVGQARLAILVDADAVAASGAGVEQGQDRRDDADPDDHDLRRDPRAIGEAQRLDPGTALDRLERHIGAKIDAVRAMFGLEELRQRLPGDAGKHPRQRLEQGDLFLQLAQDGGGLEPDITTADDHHPVRLGKIGVECVDIGTGADRVDPGEVRSRAAQLPRMTAGRPHQLAISEALTGGGVNNMLCGIDRHDGFARDQVDRAFGPESGRAERQRFATFFAGQIILR